MNRINHQNDQSSQEQKEGTRDENEKRERGSVWGCEDGLNEALISFDERITHKLVGQNHHEEDEEEPEEDEEMKEERGGDEKEKRGNHQVEREKEKGQSGIQEPKSFFSSCSLT